MNRFNFTGRLAKMSANHPWKVMAIWCIILVAGVYFGSGIGKVVNSSYGNYFNSESEQGRQLMEQRMSGPEPATEIVVVQARDLVVDAPEFKEFVGGLVDDIRRLVRKDGEPLVAASPTFYETSNDALISPDRHTTIIPVTLTTRSEEAANYVGPLVDLQKEKNGQQGFTVLTNGEGSMGAAVARVSSEDLLKAEMIGLPVALIVLVVVFGALVAAGLPLVLAMFAIAAGLGVTALIGRAFALDIFVQNVITMFGLAVGIDYALFVVERFREERGGGRERIEAIAAAGSTASRAVLFSGGTVVVSLLALLIIPDKSFRSIGLGATVVVVFAVAACLTLLPAALSLLGDRVNFGSIGRRRTERLEGGAGIPIAHRASESQQQAGFWAGTARLVMGRPWISTVLAIAALGAAALPLFTMEKGFSGYGGIPKDLDVYKAFEILDRDFSAGMVAPLEVVVDAPNVHDPKVQTAISTLRTSLERDGTFGPVEVGANAAGNLAVVSAPIKGDFTSKAAVNTTDRVRTDYVASAFADTGARTYVTGQSAHIYDMLNMLGDYTPVVFGLILGLSFVLLMILFRSVVVPIKALLMNLLSVGASYGLLVLVFQRGFGSRLFGFQQVEKIEAWLPLMLFAVLFGLSMDYHVFLLSRIREYFDATHDNYAAVHFGICHTGRIITGAALIMVAVFTAFALGRVSQFQQMGFGLGVAVILDATIVRTVLVPASMTILGDANWYLPAWLSWLPRVGFESGESPKVPPAPVLPAQPVRLSEGGAEG